MLQINSYPSAMFLPAFAYDPSKTWPLRHLLCFSCVCAHAFVVVAASLLMFWSVISESSVGIKLFVSYRYRLFDTKFCCAGTPARQKNVELPRHCRGLIFEMELVNPGSHKLYKLTFRVYSESSVFFLHQICEV